MIERWQCCLGSRHVQSFYDGQTPKSGIPPNIAPKNVTPEYYLQIWDSSATLIGQLATVTIFGAMLGGIPLSGAYPFILSLVYSVQRFRSFCLVPCVKCIILGGFSL